MRPRSPTSKCTRRSWELMRSKCRSFTRTTLAPKVSTICLSRTSARRRIVSAAEGGAAAASTRSEQISVGSIAVTHDQGRTAVAWENRRRTASPTTSG